MGRSQLSLTIFILSSIFLWACSASAPKVEDKRQPRTQKAATSTSSGDANAEKANSKVGSSDNLPQAGSGSSDDSESEAGTEYSNPGSNSGEPASSTSPSDPDVTGVGPSPEESANGAKLYEKHCASCHMPLDESQVAGASEKAIQIAIEEEAVMNHLAELSADDILSLSAALQDP